MTKYTADDFKHARFATKAYEGGKQCLAVAHQSRDSDRDDRWTLDCTSVGRSDQEMADAGWSIVRDAESLTPREHLDAAWEKAHETDVIPAGAGYITKWAGEGIKTDTYGRTYEMSARGAFFERRLLDPPPAPAWHTARIIRATHILDDSPSKWAHTEAGDWVRLSTASGAVWADAEDLRDVTVIVGADGQTKGQD